MTSRVVRTVILALVGIVWLLPVYLLLANAGKSDANFRSDALWAPGNAADLWANVVKVFTATDVPSGFTASAIYSIVAPLIAVALGAAVGFAVIVLRLRHGFTWFFVVF